jgi:predicted Fe-Mo cluster-binding NifX family protein
MPAARQPLAALAGHYLNCIVTCEITDEALRQITASNIPVFQAQPGTVSHVIAALKSGGLEKLTPERTPAAINA